MARGAKETEAKRQQRTTASGACIIITRLVARPRLSSIIAALITRRARAAATPLAEPRGARFATERPIVAGSGGRARTRWSHVAAECESRAASGVSRLSAEWMARGRSSRESSGSGVKLAKLADNAFLASRLGLRSRYIAWPFKC